MKTLITICMSLSLMIMPALVLEASSASTNRLYLDSTEISNASSFMSNMELYVAVRPILKADGLTMVWDSGKKTLKADRAGLSVLLRLDSTKAIVNGKSITLRANVMQRAGSIFLTADDLAIVLDKQISKSLNLRSIYFKSSLKDMITKTLRGKDSEFTYEGKLVLEKRSGKGKLFKKGQLIYEGDFAQHTLDGYGKLYLNGELAVEGGFRNNEPHGSATYYMSNGEVYEGAFHSGRMTGKGSLFRGKILLYDGDWLDDKMSGVGQVYDAEGELTYAGEIKNNLRDGLGIQFAHGNKEYQGYWHNGLMQGEGKLFNDEGEITYMGSFVADRMEGLGTAVSFKNMTYSSAGLNNTIIFEDMDTAIMEEGQYKNGKLIYATGKTIWYTGQFDANKIPNGVGKYYSTTGTFASRTGVSSHLDMYYEGAVKEGKLHGVGKYYVDDLLSYDGEFSEDARHGKGKEYENGSLIYYGEWNNGRRSGQGKTFEYLTDVKNFTGTNTAIIIEAEFHLGQLRTKKTVYKYIGKFANGAITGKGNLYLLDEASPISYFSQSGANAFYGDFKDGLRHGDGLIINKDLTKRFEGKYVDDLREGAGKEYVGGTISYDGSYLKDMKHGLGKLYDGIVLVYEGYFKEDKKHGYGKAFKNGLLIFEGEFIDGVQQ